MEIRYRPVPVKDLLRDMKNLSWLMVNLAYTAVIYGDRVLAREVYELERAVDSLDLQLTMQASLATRNTQDAERMVSVFRLAAGANRISDAAADIASVLETRSPLPPGMWARIFDSEDALGRVEVPGEYDGMRVSELGRAVGTIDVLAVRRDSEVLLEPSESFVLRRGDVLVVKGSLDNVRGLQRLFGAEVLETDVEPVEKYRGVLEGLVQIRNTSIVMVDLAYTAMLTKSEDLARRIVEFEEYVDRLLSSFEEDVVSNPGLTPEEKVGVLRIAVAGEEISDAAVTMVQPLLLGLEPHPIIVDVLWETFERISVVEMDEEDEGKTLGELGYSRRGVTVLAVRRDDDWIVMPPYSGFRVRSGDILIVKYVSESEDFVEELEREEDREEIIEEIQEEEWEEE